jgi:competence protein ComEC
MFITNFTASIVRAGIFFIFLTINKEYKLNIKTVNLLLLTLIISLLGDPHLIYNIGFQFSFLISLYLILFGDLIKKYKSKISKLFIVSFISFLGGLPIVLNNYFEFNLLSIILNLIYVPFVSIIVFPLSFLYFIIPIFDKLLYVLIELLENSSILFSNIKTFVITLGKPTFLLIIIYYLFITFILYKMKNNKYSFLLLVIPLLLNYMCNNNKYPEVTFIDVGQGDSILIRLNTKNILIDTGGIVDYNEEQWKTKNKNYSIGKDTIVPYLKSLGIRDLDYLIITHGDNDHIGEAINIIDGILVKEVIMNSGDTVLKEKELINYLDKLKMRYSFKKEGDIIEIDNYKFYVLNPYKYTNENDSSIVLYTKIFNTKLSFMADAGIEVEKYLMNKYNLDIDILKVGHHGSNTSSYPEFIKSISLKYAIIEVGLNNKFNHPSNSVLETLNENNIKIYQTSINGSIRMIFKKDKFEILTCLQ